jgi:alanine dehydrogenase
MSNKTILGIIREGKVPPDARVPLTPQQCTQIMNDFPGVTIVVQSSTVRCFKDSEYEEQGIPVLDDVSHAEILLGVKEAPITSLIEGKTYLFFSHTIKKQPYNQKLLRALLDKKIRMIDYEVITDERGVRLIAFGYYAGVVGAHNGIWAYGLRTGTFTLPRMNQCHDYEEVCAVYPETSFPPMKILVTGGGRVATGALHTLRDMGFREVSPAEYLNDTFDVPVYTQIHAADYAQRRDGQPFEKQDFYKNGHEYESAFAAYSGVTDVFLNCIYYDKKAPAFFTVAEMTAPDFNIKTIADITCDIMPGASVPSTIRPSDIVHPLYGFNPATGEECDLFHAAGIDVMAVDNLPSELPRDASDFFGKQLIANVLPELLKGKSSDAIMRGMVAENGDLGPHFEYLRDYAEGKGF